MAGGHNDGGHNGGGHNDGGHNDGGSAKNRVIVPDRDNNRVLIYNHPTDPGQAADAVLGQPGFITNTPGVSATAMSAPRAYAIDDDGNLLVSDTQNCRVLLFRPPFTNGEAAKVVIGKPDANTPCAGSVSASNLGNTSGIAIDDNGNLWVVDASNNRVLRFKAPFKTGKAADIVIGQPDFVTTTIGPGCLPPTASNLCFPSGITVDSSNNLWVSDSGYNRVLEYKQPKKSMSANIELGHPAATAFTSGTANDGGISASSLSGPDGLGFDSKDRLWVADGGNSRVLRFNPKIHNGDAATLVLGQPDATSGDCNQTLTTANAQTLCVAQGIEILRNGDLWVGDSGNNRTLRFTVPFSPDQPADMVLGQADLDSKLANRGNAAPDETTQNSPFGGGPSLIAVGVLAGLAGGRELLRRIRFRA